MELQFSGEPGYNAANPGYRVRNAQAVGKTCGIRSNTTILALSWETKRMLNIKNSFMTIIVNKERGADGIDTTAVHALHPEMVAFLKAHGRIIHTKEKRVFITLPIIFEMIDGSNVAIVRPMDTKAIPEFVTKEFKDA